LVSVLKADFHIHTAEDPIDAIPYNAFELVDRAAALGYGAVAITLHDKQLAIEEVADYGRRHGVVVIAGIERTIGGKHVLLLNFSSAAETVDSFDDVRRLKKSSGGVVIAPHPFYPMPSCLRRELDRHVDLFDAVEINAFYIRACDYNRRAAAWASRHGKPLVGNGDVHRLSQLGTTYSLIDAAPDADAICEAIRAGRVEVRTAPISALRAAALFASLAAGALVRRWLPADTPTVSPSQAS
jgi:predicted metal-dependent phosphoesterase TrpH